MTAYYLRSKKPLTKASDSSYVQFDVENGDINYAPPAKIPNDVPKRITIYPPLPGDPLNQGWINWPYGDVVVSGADYTSFFLASVNKKIYVKIETPVSPGVSSSVTLVGKGVLPT